MSSSTSIRDILSKPTWSVRSLLTPSPESPAETITPSQLHHLLRLSALPLPRTKAEEESMISTLQSQLQFVRAVQRVETTGVEPLTAIRDETEQGLKEITVKLDDLRPALDKEKLVGYYQRPRRLREKLEPEEEKWDALATAPRRADRFFVVEGAKDAEQESG
jgi:Asp-tRNA(Asn)/Glu-tRNA(Gln) amidotransferase C subunit